MKKNIFSILYYLVISFVYYEFLSFHNYQGIIGLGTLSISSFCTFLIIAFLLKRVSLKNIIIAIIILGYLAFLTLFFYVWKDGYNIIRILRWFKTWYPYVFQLLFVILSLVHNIPLFWYIKR